MKNDVHLIGFSAPVSKWFDEQRAACGKILDHPVTVCMFDELAMGSSFRESLKGVCKKCLERIGSERYVYGIRGSK